METVKAGARHQAFICDTVVHCQLAGQAVWSKVHRDLRFRETSYNRYRFRWPDWGMPHAAKLRGREAKTGGGRAKGLRGEPLNLLGQVSALHLEYCGWYEQPAPSRLAGMTCRPRGQPTSRRNQTTLISARSMSPWSCCCGAPDRPEAPEQCFRAPEEDERVLAANQMPWWIGPARNRRRRLRVSDHQPRGMHDSMDAACMYAQPLDLERESHSAGLSNCPGKRKASPTLMQMCTFAREKGTHHHPQVVGKGPSMPQPTWAPPHRIRLFSSRGILSLMPSACFSQTKDTAAGSSHDT